MATLNNLHTTPSLHSLVYYFQLEYILPDKGPILVYAYHSLTDELVETRINSPLLTRIVEYSSKIGKI